MGFPRQEYWSGLPFPPPGDLPHPGIEPVSLMSPALAGRFFTTSVRPRIRAFVPRRKNRATPINQPSRCNTQEGLLPVAQTGDSDLLGGRAPRTANWASFICSILHTGCKVIGYTFAKQSYWYKLRGLHVYKAILLAQTSRAFVQT